MFTFGRGDLRKFRDLDFAVSKKYARDFAVVLFVF